MVEFPLFPQLSAEEKRALLRKRFDELIDEKLAIEKQVKLQNDRIHEEYKQTMIDMVKLEMDAEKPEEDLLEYLSAVKENHKRRKNAENWVEAAASTHSAGLTQAVEQQLTQLRLDQISTGQTEPPPQFKPSWT